MTISFVHEYLLLAMDADHQGPLVSLTDEGTLRTTQPLLLTSHHLYKWYLWHYICFSNLISFTVYLLPFRLSCLSQSQHLSS